LFVTAGQLSYYIGARAPVSSLSKVDLLQGDRGYDADWLRDAVKDKEIRACIPGRKQRKKPVEYDKRRCKRRNRIEIMVGRLNDWRCVAIRKDSATCDLEPSPQKSCKTASKGGTSSRYGQREFIPSSPAVLGFLTQNQNPALVYL
jgi:transposase